MHIPFENYLKYSEEEKKLTTLNEVKKCIKCGEFKTLNNYGYRSHGRDGTKTEQRNDCKSCIKKQVDIVSQLKKKLGTSKTQEAERKYEGDVASEGNLKCGEYGEESGGEDR